MKDTIEKSVRKPLITGARLALSIPGESAFWRDVETQLDAADIARKPKVESRVAESTRKGD